MGDSQCVPNSDAESHLKGASRAPNQPGLLLLNQGSIFYSATCSFRIFPPEKKVFQNASGLLFLSLNITTQGNSVLIGLRFSNPCPLDALVMLTGHPVLIGQKGDVLNHLKGQGTLAAAPRLAGPVDAQAPPPRRRRAAAHQGIRAIRDSF